MIFYTISCANGRFCGYRWRFSKWWVRRVPDFRWDVMPFDKPVVSFSDRPLAERYIAEHRADFPESTKIMQTIV